MELLMVAGETSGDLHGGALAEALKRLDPSCILFGIGGECMAAAGVDILTSVDRLGVTGFMEVLEKLPHVLGVMRSVISEARRRRPTAAVLIDYPDFNLRLARRLHRLGIPVIYYISPQLWAWRPWRVKIVRHHVARMLVLFPFEVDWYGERGVDAEFVGNPILDRFETVPSRVECRERLSITSGDTVVAMLPGSRINEVRRHLPVLLKAVSELRRGIPGIRFLLCRAPHVPDTVLDRYPGMAAAGIEIVSEPSPIVLRAADIAWVTSGTSTLETALAGTPMIIFYKMNPVSYLLARLLVRVDAVGIINLVAGKKIVPELIQSQFTAERVTALTRRMLSDVTYARDIRSALAEVVRKFGDTGAAFRAAKAVLSVCGSIVPKGNG